MPTGVGAVTVVNDPSVQTLRFLPDPQAFFDLTERNVYTPIQFATPGSGSTEVRQLPQAGLLAMVRLLFVGTLTTTLGGGTVTTRARWPYGFLDRVILSANAQNDVYNAAGEDLETLRRVRAANSFGGAAGLTSANAVDEFGGGTSASPGAGGAIPTGATDLVLSWELPVAIDPTTLIGSIYAQSSAMNLQLSIRQITTTDLMVAAGGATIDSLTGTWFVEVETFDIPIIGAGAEARLVVPDVTRLHIVQGVDTAYTNTGEVPATLIRGNGQLDRLLVSVALSNPNTGTTNPYLDPRRGAAAASRLDAVRIEYGNSQRPLDYNPAHFLAAANAVEYGSALLPYGNVAFDFLAHNPPRDIIQMAGVTDLRVIPTVNAGATVVAGARVRAVQEMLIG